MTSQRIIPIVRAYVCAYVRACVLRCVRPCVRKCVRACVRACLRNCVRACVGGCVCAWAYVRVRVCVYVGVCVWVFLIRCSRSSRAACQVGHSPTMLALPGTDYNRKKERIYIYIFK